MNFELTLPGRIIFGEGKINDLPALTTNYGSQVFLVRGKNGAVSQAVQDLLSNAGFSSTSFEVDKEPDIHLIADGVQSLRQSTVQWVLGVGGGSVLDSAKAIAGLASNPGDVMDYLEVVGAGKPLVARQYPIVLAPTTAGTGSECTRNAVLDVPERKVKVSLRSQTLLADIAIVDPTLTLSVPPNVTAFTGMDALAQVYEPFLSRRANPLVDALCREGMTTAIHALPSVVRNGNRLEDRKKMCYTSMLGGMALANAGLGAIHGFAGPLGGLLHAPHGAICARLFPAVVRQNWLAAQQNRCTAEIKMKMQEAAHLLTGQADADGLLLAEFLNQFIDSLDIPRLRDWGLEPHHFDLIAAQSASASSMKSNPVTLEQSELLAILAEAH